MNNNLYKTNFKYTRNQNNKKIISIKQNLESTWNIESNKFNSLNIVAIVRKYKCSYMHTYIFQKSNLKYQLDKI